MTTLAPTPGEVPLSLSANGAAIVAPVAKSLTDLFELLLNGGAR